MGKKSRIWNRVVLAALLIVLVCRPLTACAQSSENYRVLFLSSYSYTWSTVPLQIDGIQSALDAQVTLDVEFMDTKMIDLEPAERMTRERIQIKQDSAGRYDAVIVGDDAALRFAVNSREELFPGVPIVFEGINNVAYAREVSTDPLITGVIEQFSYEENLQFAKKIQPDARKVVAIVDDTVTGIGEQQQFFAQRASHPELAFEVINGSLLTRQQIIDRISAADTDSILIYLILSEDAEGHIYTNEQTCQILKQYAKVPVLRFVQAGIGEGVLGGNIVLHRASGQIAAEMVMEILRGKDPAQIEMVSESPNGYYLDQQVLDRFGIPGSLVPEGAEVINRKVTFWQKHGAVILMTLGASASVMIILLLVIRAIYSRRRLAELEKNNERLASAAQEAQEATRAKSVFLHSMSHDIRTPMNAIIGFTDIAMKQNTDEAVEKYLQKIMTSSEHLLTLINDVLDISRIENGKAAYRPVPTNLCAVTDGVLAIIQGFLSGRNLTFRVERPQTEQHCTVLADPVRVREVLVNILSNAVKFTEDGGTIVFSMGMNPGTDETHAVVWFTVSDTGCGMSEAFLPHVFEEFAQEESGARTQYKGTGLGMAITKRYVDMMGGTISVKSKKGEGTTFTVELPLELTCQTGSQKPEQPQKRKDLTGLDVLMAEDNDLNAEIVTFQLEEAGMRVVRAEDGVQAVKCFTENPAGTFDVILMDVMMPHMDGYGATQAIRSMTGRPDGKTIPIIAMTANAFTEDVQVSLDAGMNAHLTKPLSMEELLKTISAMV